MRGDVGVPRHRHEALAIQRTHRQKIGADLALVRVFFGVIRSFIAMSLLVLWSTELTTR